MRALNILGSKARHAKDYPAPRHETIVEPFAGGAGYSLHHFQKRVILFDLRPAVCEAWRYLIRASPDEVLALPLLQPSQRVSDLDCSDDAKAMLRWCTNQSAGPRDTPSKWAAGKRNWVSFWSPRRRITMATIAKRVKHWKIFCGAYQDIPLDWVAGSRATWFVDPPYQRIPTAYGTPALDYGYLAQWCQILPGQVIVCEEHGADWLPFRPAYSLRAAKAQRHTKEVVWTNDAPCVAEGNPK